MNFNTKALVRISLFLIIFITAIFYIFARGININILPIEAAEQANITIRQGLGFQFSNRFIFFPGKKIVLVESPGFYREEHTLSINSSSDTYSVELEKLPGKIMLNIIPLTDTKVYVDEQIVIPDEDGLYEIAAGTRQLVITNPLYVRKESEISIIGMGKEQNFSFELEPNWASVSFTADQSNIEIYLNGEFLGVTPLNYKIVSGIHEIIYKKSGYQDLITIERIKRNISRAIDLVELDLLPAFLAVTSIPNGAKVLIDNQFSSFTPAKISLTPDTQHNIVLELDGYKEAKKTVNIKSNETSSIEFDLEELLGKVVIDSNIEADIYIDNNFLAVTPYAGQLHAVPKQIILKKENYRPFLKTIKTTPNYITNITAVMFTEEQARLAESPKQYTTKVNNKMVLLEPGLIVMGAERSEIGQRANETIRKVNLTKPFYLSIHEITNSQFIDFAQEVLGKKIKSNLEPVVSISWNDAALYCNWLSKKEGLSLFYQVSNNRVQAFNLKSEGYRMPTEAEWSWAARSYSKKDRFLIFPWGDTMPVLKNTGNFADESAKGSSSSYIANYNDGFTSLAPVGSFPPNDKGIYDLGGNVSEFVNDFYSIMLNSSVIQKDLTGPSTGRSHVVKDSNWNSANITELRYSYRNDSTLGDNKTGFRIARWLIGKDDAAEL
jgi:formylglycine-generating enzyme required for sulfatase activity